MQFSPFAYMATSGETPAFDPTLGGAISPYFWYDFTDSSTMTLSGTDITEIDSKGSNVGSLAPGGSTKYTGANYVAPTYDSSDGGFAVFSGSANPSNVVSGFSRRYGSGDSRTDGDFGNNNPATSIIILKPNWNSVSATSWNRVASFKGYSVTSPAVQPEEWTLCAITDNVTYPGNTYNATGSFSTSNNNSVQIQSLDGSTNSTVRFSYNTSGDVTGGILDYYHSAVARLTTTGGSFATSKYGRSSTEFQGPSFDGPRGGSNSNFEGYTIGSRALSTSIQGASFTMRHALLYDATLTDQQITDVLDSYKAAYPQDGLNGS